MPAMPGAERLERISLQWHDLANRRLAYFIELYQSGRWRHYYTQEKFAVRMLDVIKALKNWDEIAARAGQGGAQIPSDELRPAA